MKDSPPGEWFPWYYRRFFRSPRVLAMTASQKCLYFAALCLQFEEGRLPDDQRTLQTLLAGCFGSWEEDWPPVEACFASGRNPMMSEIRDEVLSRQKRRSEAGKAGRQAQLGQSPGNRRRSPGQSPGKTPGTGQDRTRQDKTETPQRGVQRGARAPGSASPRLPVDLPDLEEALTKHPELGEHRPGIEGWIAARAAASEDGSLTARDRKSFRLTPRGLSDNLRDLARAAPHLRGRALELATTGNGSVPWKGLHYGVDAAAKEKGSKPESRAPARVWDPASRAEPAKGPARLTDSDWEGAMDPIRKFLHRGNGNPEPKEKP